MNLFVLHSSCCQTNGLCVVPYAIQLLFVQFPEGYFMFSGVIFMKNFTSRLALEGLPLLDFRQYQSADSDNTFLGIFLASRNENPHTIYQLASFDKVNLKAVIEGDIPILTSGFMPGHARKKHMQ
ncbi:hypothetical protein JTB14_022001 [Gonioctena quinquepunctata]|nr:hypothetical protein JTB14_022001 [Gonioctena quinquepunctata]